MTNEVPIIPWPIWLAALDVLKAAEQVEKYPWQLKIECQELRDLIARYPISLVPPDPRPILGMTPELKSSFDECLDLIAAESRRTGKSFEEILHSASAKAYAKLGLQPIKPPFLL